MMKIFPVISLILCLVLSHCQQWQRLGVDEHHPALTVELQPQKSQWLALLERVDSSSFRYSDMLSGCDFAEGEYERLEKEYDIDLSKEEFNTVVECLKEARIVALDTLPSTKEDSSPVSQPCFYWYLYGKNEQGNTEIKVTLYPLKHGPSPYNVGEQVFVGNFISLRSVTTVAVYLTPEVVERLKALDSFRLYEAREAEAQRILKEQNAEVEEND